MAIIKIIGSAALLVYFCGVVFAAAPESYDLCLSGDGTYMYTTSQFENSNDKLLAFDLWYDARTEGDPNNVDLYPCVGSNLYSRTTFARRYSSTQWETLTFDMVPNSEVSMYLGTLQSGGKFYVRNIRGYDSYDEYVRSAEDDNSNDNGGSDQPVPEPATLAMMGAGFLGLIGFEIKRRRTS